MTEIYRNRPAWTGEPKPPADQATPPTRETVDVTPARAAELMRDMWPSRDLNRKHVDKLTAAMRGGAWASEDHPVTIGRDGRLVGGQHALAAVMEVGRAVPLCVVTYHPGSAS